MLPPGSDYLYKRTLANPENVNHGIEYIVFVGNKIDRDLRAKLLLLAQLIDEPCFDQLRTKEQLGYVVGSGALTFSTVSAFRIIIQSDRDCDHLEGRIDAFLHEFEAFIEKMPQSDFEELKVGLINKFNAKVAPCTFSTVSIDSLGNYDLTDSNQNKYKLNNQGDCLTNCVKFDEVRSKVNKE